ncbi:MAG: hypothetical protein GXY48_05495 [Methanomicrobiales archaeon]|nr:hypothetical protein [Methanomicrobiales archaeon]
MGFTKDHQEKIQGNEEEKEIYQNTDQVKNLLSARVVLHEIRGDLYRYICTPEGRDTVKSGFFDKFSLLQSKTSSYIQTGQDNVENRSDEDFSRLLTVYEELVHAALDDIDRGKKHEIIVSLHDGPLHQSHLNIDEFLSTATDSLKAGESVHELDNLQAQVNALFTIIELIGAIAVLFPGVFVSIGVPATLARSVTMLNQVQKVYPSVQLALDRKHEIMILVGTMAAFAGGMHKNATRLLQQMAADENMQNITVIDETGKTIPGSELVQYALDLQNNKNKPEEEGSAAYESKQLSGKVPDPDMVKKLTGLLDAITKPVSESLKAADTYAHQGIQARLEDVSRGKEFILQVPLTLSDVGSRVGTDITIKMQELTEKVSSITGKETREEKKP